MHNFQETIKQFKKKFKKKFKKQLPKIIDGAYVIDLKSIGTHWIALYVNDNNVTYFDSFSVEHIPK